jgi:hypothetical protein
VAQAHFGPRPIPLTRQERGHFDANFKRLEKGTFRFPSATEKGDGVEIRGADLTMLLDGVDLNSVKRQKRYRRPQPASAEQASA